MRTFVAALALTVTLGACAGSDTTDTTSPVTETTPAVDSTRPAAETTMARETTTTAPGADTTAASAGSPTTSTTTGAADDGELASCIVGAWELDDEGFLSLVEDAATAMDTGGGGVDVLPNGGLYQITVDADGSWTSERIDWGWSVYIGDEDEINIIINGTTAGTWSIDGEDLTVDVESDDTTMDVTGVVGGVDVDLGAAGLPDGFETDAMVDGTAPVTCDGDTITVASEDAGGFTTTWLRI